MLNASNEVNCVGF